MNGDGYAPNYTVPNFSHPEPSNVGVVSAGSGLEQGAYGGIAPTDTPSGPTERVDTDTGKVWYFVDGEWVFSGITLSL